MDWEFLLALIVLAGSGWAFMSGLLRRRHPSDPSMFDYASWPRGAYTAARWAGAACFVVCDVVIAYGLLGLAFGWFEGYGDAWWLSALRVALAMCLLGVFGTVLDFLTSGEPIKARTQGWHSLSAARKRRFFSAYAVGATTVMLAVNVLMWLWPA
jgi:hypothetical protein